MIAAANTGKRVGGLAAVGMHAPADFFPFETTNVGEEGVDRYGGVGDDAGPGLRDRPAGDLKAHLEEARCVVQVLDPHTLEVSIPPRSL